jgi:hypothetical protein
MFGAALGARISKEINVGDYLLIAETIGDEGYEGSRSDPPLKVLAETVVELSSPDKVVMGEGSRLTAP